MTGDILKDRERALEYEFFHRLDEQLLEQIREQLRAEERQKILAEGIGIQDECVLQELDGLGIRPECVVALSLFPMVYVAWADGIIEPRERTAILEAAENLEHKQDSPSYRLLAAWLDKRPGNNVFEAWKHYVFALFATLSPVARRVTKYTLMARAQHVTEAGRSILRLHRVQATEETALAELDEILQAANRDAVHSEVV